MQDLKSYVCMYIYIYYIILYYTILYYIILYYTVLYYIIYIYIYYALCMCFCWGVKVRDFPKDMLKGPRRFGLGGQCAGFGPCRSVSLDFGRFGSMQCYMMYFWFQVLLLGFRVGFLGSAYRHTAVGFTGHWLHGNASQDLPFSRLARSNIGPLLSWGFLITIIV